MSEGHFGLSSGRMLKEKQSPSSPQPILCPPCQVPSPFSTAQAGLGGGWGDHLQAFPGGRYWGEKELKKKKDVNVRILKNCTPHTRADCTFQDGERKHMPRGQVDGSFLRPSFPTLGPALLPGPALPPRPLPPGRTILGCTAAPSSRRPQPPAAQALRPRPLAQRGGVSAQPLPRRVRGRADAGRTAGLGGRRAACAAAPRLTHAGAGHDLPRAAGALRAAAARPAPPPARLLPPRPPPSLPRPVGVPASSPAAGESRSAAPAPAR